MSLDLDSAYPLPAGAGERFRRDGFVRLKGLFSPDELDHHGAVIERLTLQRSSGRPPLQERGTYGRAFLQVTNLWEQSDLAREFVFGERLARIAAELLEVDGVRLYHDQSLIKEPGGGITPAHADQFYWPLASDRTVTAWVPLQAVPAEMGPIGFYAGSQRFEFGRDLPISDESEARISAEMQSRGFPLADDPFEPGEVSFHSGWTFHRAGPNRTDRPRSVMTIIYMERDMRLAEPSPGQRADRDAFCPGIEVGEVIDSPKNPVLWERGWVQIGEDWNLYYAGDCMITLGQTRRTPGRKWRDLAWSLWITPVIALSPFVFLPLLMDFKSAIKSVVDAWEIYLLFFALPWAGGIAAWTQARRVDREHIRKEPEERTGG